MRHSESELQVNQPRQLHALHAFERRPCFFRIGDEERHEIATPAMSTALNKVELYTRLGIQKAPIVVGEREKLAAVNRLTKTLQSIGSDEDIHVHREPSIAVKEHRHRAGHGKGDSQVRQAPGYS